MRLKLENRNLPGIPYHFDAESYFIAPWMPEHPDNILTFDAYIEELKFAEASDLKMPGYSLATSGGWVAGRRTQPTLPTVLARNWDDVMHRMFPGQKGLWRHSGKNPDLPDVAVIPDHLPGGGMVVLKNQAPYLAFDATGDFDVRKKAQEAAQAASLTKLGFERI